MDERAVQLDSDCLTAWRGLSGLILELPAGFQLTVTENELRLSPPLSGYYYYYDLDIPDYRRCWLEAAKACARRIPSSTMLFELRASRAALQGGEDQGFLQNELRMDDQFPPPGAEIAGDRVIEAIDRLCTKPFSPG